MIYCIEALPFAGTAWVGLEPTAGVNVHKGLAACTMDMAVNNKNNPTKT
ncbi:hypothetical protein [Legionella quateirensis]|nr:hypothetical protein [Legionella quateirensis]